MTRISQAVSARVRDAKNNGARRDADPVRALARKAARMTYKQALEACAQVPDGSMLVVEGIGGAEFDGVRPKRAPEGFVQDGPAVECPGTGVVVRIYRRAL